MNGPPKKPRIREDGLGHRRGRLAGGEECEALTGIELAVLLVRALDLIGAFVFALNRAALGVQRDIDLSASWCWLSSRLSSAASRETS